MVPGLEERIMSGNDEELMEVSEHVSQFSLGPLCRKVAYLHSSCRKVYPALEPMIPRA